MTGLGEVEDFGGGKTYIVGDAEGAVFPVRGGRWWKKVAELWRERCDVWY